MYTGEVVRLEVPGYVVYVAEARTRGVMVSFVNGVSTPDHGAHVTHVSRRLHEAVASSLGDEPPWRRFVAERLFIMLLARLDRPSFRGNEKSSVCLPLRPEPGKFGRAALRGSRVPLLWREWGESSASSSLQRDERRRRKLTVEKLDDAAQAGSREWQRCTLILTEGDSAKSFALAGLAVVGRVYYGVFPLRGKVKNVRDSTATQADGNKELRSLKTILGLSSGSGLDAHALRYGRVLIMTDQDVDGFHIKGLVLNFLDSQFPGLIGARLFVECMRTPLIKAVVRGTTHEFFSVSSYDAFARERAAPCASVKYYKGLGTSTAAEARAYFSDLRRYVVRYTPVGMERLTQLFAKGTIAERKSSVRAALCAVARDEAVEQRDDDGFVVQSIGSLVDTELMEYSVDAVHRCIPSVVDGLKPSQRKILWSMLRGASGEKKVAQLASYVAHDTAYHHGEASLQQAIIGMAQDFTGSNNCELLQPIGQFGTRRAGGDDAASPRYIFTRLACVATAVFVADDLALVPPRHDEGQSIEPPFLLPVIPWLLVNGASGIGTAFSTVVPPHDVRCVCAATRAWVLAHQREGASSAPAPELTMSVRGFTGPVLLEAGRSRYRTTTVVRLERPGVVAVTDLPVGMWTDAYKDLLDGLLERKRIGRYVNESTDTRVLFRVEGVVDVADLEAERFVSVRNMHALDETHGLRLWASVGEIVDYFCVLRLPYYEMRLARSIADAESALTRISGIRDLIDLVISGGAGVLFSCEDTDALFETLRFVRVGGSYDHLLRVSVRCCTLARRDHMARELITTEAALVALRGTSAYALWLTDISNVERVVAA
jgi:DNA topoisomerase-2